MIYSTLKLAWQLATFVCSQILNIFLFCYKREINLRLCVNIVLSKMINKCCYITTLIYLFQSFQLSEEDLVLLTLYRTEAVVKATWTNVEVLYG